MKKIIDPRTYIRTSDEDPLHYYSMPFIGSLYRRRLSMVKGVIAKRKFNRLLEIGYGSGIFMPFLSDHAQQLYGVDIHHRNADVARMLLDHGIKATLTKGNTRKLPYSDNQFDCVIAISILEHISDLDATFKEIRRVLRPGGVLIAGSPVKNQFMETVFKYVLKFDSKKHHPNGHRDIISGVGTCLKVKNVQHFPALLPIDMGFYFSLEAVKE